MFEQAFRNIDDVLREKAGCTIRSQRLQARFLFHQLNRNRHFLAFANGENQTNLRLNQVLNCPLFVPSPAEQKKAAASLDALSKETQHLTSVYERQLAALDELKKSLLHQGLHRDPLPYRARHHAI